MIKPYSWKPPYIWVWGAGFAKLYFSASSLWTSQIWREKTSQYHLSTTIKAYYGGTCGLYSPEISFARILIIATKSTIFILTKSVVQPFLLIRLLRLDHTGLFIFINIIHFLLDFTYEWNEISIFSKMFKGFGSKTTSTNNFKQDRNSN